MAIFAELDAVGYAFPWADTCLFFDDLAVATHGPRTFVAHWHAALVQTLVHMFEMKLDMVVSKGEQGKTITMTSNPELYDTIGRRIKAMGLRMASTGNHLGVTTAAGRRRRVTAVSKRAVKFAARRARLTLVRRAEGPADAIVKRAQVPSIMYGAQVMGLSDTRLSELRHSVAATAGGNHKGRSSHLVLLADGSDPAVAAYTAPILAWAKAWKETHLQPNLREHLQAAWKKWVMRVARARVPWQVVRGPAGAFVATVRRLGWQTQAAHSITVDGEVLDLRTLPAHELRYRIGKATEDGLKRAWMERSGAT